MSNLIILINGNNILIDKTIIIYIYLSL